MSLSLTATPQAQHVTVSYSQCRRIARSAARNFYYGFLLLPAAKRDALCAIYAFMRQADDISDSESQNMDKRQRLENWRRTLDRTLAGAYGQNPILPAFHDTVTRFGIPPRYFYELISGVEMDLKISSYETFEQLRQYCYGVAGTVGLSCLYVFGFRERRAPELAEKLGIAFQLTNILRDISEDTAMGRLYLPQEDLDRFGCRREDLVQRIFTSSFVDLMRFQTERAWRFYQEGTELLPLVSADSQPALWALMRIYSGILEKIEARRYDIFSSPHTGLSDAEKLWILIRGRLGWWTPACPRRM
ncbi:MAG TPA: phytoene/squalene synthase family protein [Acidobacteriota bacterium]|jgi:phytoene synthase